MLRIVIATLFVFVIGADFIIEVGRKNINVADLIIRGFMVLACAYLFKSL